MGATAITLLLVSTGADAGSFAAAATARKPRFVEIGSTDGIVADWVTTDGRRMFFGSGRRLYEASAGPPVAVESRRDLAAPVSDALLVGERLFLVESGTKLATLDVAASGSGPVPFPLVPRPRGKLRLARVAGNVAVAESGRGIRLLDSVGSHLDPERAAGMRRWREVGLIPLDDEIAALTASDHRWFVGLAGGGIREYDLLPVPATRPGRTLPFAGEARDLSVVGNELYVLGSSALEVLAPTEEGGSATVVDVGGSRLAVTGRILYVAAGIRGVVTLRDIGEGIAIHQVDVGNNFFSPAELTVDVGDFVEWRNLAGFHNVFSCVADEVGCEGETSSETFTSGPPAGPPWFFDHQFLSPGTNRYLCQAHPVQMQGRITVVGASAGPPEVPDGVAGSPMRVRRLDATGSTLEVSWDTATCPGAVDHLLVYGWGERLPNDPAGPYRLAGAACDVGPDSPFLWSDAPDPSGHASRFVWWLVLATDGGVTEGSWGANSAGIERAGTGPSGASGECGVEDKTQSECMP